DVFPRIGVVELDVLNIAARCDIGLAPAALFHALEVLVLDLQVPGEVVLAGLDDGAGGRVGVAAALHLDGVEVRAVGHVIGRVQLALDEVAGLEVGEPVGPGAHRLQAGRRLPRLRALEALEEVLGDDHPAHADERIGPAPRGPGDGDLDGVAVDLVDLDLLVGPAAGAGAGGLGRVLPVEDDVVGRE